MSSKYITAAPLGSKEQRLVAQSSHQSTGMATGPTAVQVRLGGAPDLLCSAVLANFRGKKKNARRLHDEGCKLLGSRLYTSKLLSSLGLVWINTFPPTTYGLEVIYMYPNKALDCCAF